MLEINIDSNTPIPIYRQIVEQVKQLIADEQLKPGEQIPSVRDLARWLQLNPSTIARAYYDLKKEGVVVASRRRGTIIIGNNRRLPEIQLNNSQINKVDAQSLMLPLTQQSALEGIATAFTLHPARWRVQRMV
jgi:DNA-binding transcriptional regulator YhcF (GntR family)